MLSEWSFPFLSLGILYRTPSTIGLFMPLMLRIISLRFLSCRIRLRTYAPFTYYLLLAGKWFLFSGCTFAIHFIHLLNLLSPPIFYPAQGPLVYRISASPKAKAITQAICQFCTLICNLQVVARKIHGTFHQISHFDSLFSIAGVWWARYFGIFSRCQKVETHKCTLLSWTSQNGIAGGCFPSSKWDHTHQ
jgi:hypothetical protein